MEKYKLTSLKQLANSDKKMRQSGDLILINKKNLNNDNGKTKINKSFTNQIKYKVLINKQKPIQENKKTLKYYISESRNTENLKNNNFRDNINVRKSHKIFNYFIRKNNDDSKSRQQKYRYQIPTNGYNFFSSNNNNENYKISVNQSNELFNQNQNIVRKSTKSDLTDIKKIIYIHNNYKELLKTQKIKVNKDIKNIENKTKTNFFTKLKTPQKETTNIKKRPHSIKYNHIKIQRNIKKVNELFDLNGINITKKIGEQLNKYTIGKTLGKGAYGIVKLVTDKETKIDYAMKIYKKNEIKDKVRKKCVNNEIDILKKIEHKNIIKLIEVIDLKDYILIVEELFLGISLGQYHKKYWKTEDLTRKKEKIYKIILTQIFSAMDYLHKNGIAHLDIKMDNILINNKLDIKIIDFGFAIHDPKQTLNNFFGGTPNYMSPEIILKRPYISVLSDIWSLGVLVFKLFCNEYPFKGFTEKDLYNCIKKGKFRIKCYVNYDVKKIINSMLVLEANKRSNCGTLLKLPWFCVNNK